jgi:hypothetical protein
MKPEKLKNEDTKSKYSQKALQVDDSFALLLASYRSRVYEQYHSFITGSSEESQQDNVTPY